MIITDPDWIKKLVKQLINNDNTTIKAGRGVTFDVPFYYLKGSVDCYHAEVIDYGSAKIIFSVDEVKSIEETLDPECVGGKKYTLVIP